MNTHAGQRLSSILASQPFHLMYEENKRGATGVTNLNPYLRQQLGGAETAYPASPDGACDVVFTLDGQRVWMECKLMQPHNGGNKPQWRFEDRNPNFEKHLGLVGRDHASAVRDVRDRLPTLARRGVADRIAFLMVAYDSPRWSIDEPVTKFVQIGGLGAWAHDVLYLKPDPREKAKPERARIQILYWERLVAV